MFRQMYYTWQNRIHSGKRERERGHLLPEEVKEQVENTSRNVGIRIVWKKERELLSTCKCVNESLLYFTMYNAINCNHYINKVMFIY